MKLIWTIIWSFLLSSMVVYVIGNMNGTHFDFTLVAVLTVSFTIAAAVLGDGILKEDDAS
ncbi:MAG: YjzD family protein [Bacillaceae bacterium]|nr:YjzD family protein [Bacillaceae bacterium]